MENACVKLAKPLFMWRNSVICNFLLAVVVVVIYTSLCFK